MSKRVEVDPDDDNAANEHAPAKGSASDGAETLSATNMHSIADVPVGYELLWNASGMPYLSKKADEHDDVDAEMEHVAEQLPFRISFDEIERRFGVGTRVYWHFLTFIIVTNLILGIVVGAGWGQYYGVNRADSIATAHCSEVAGPFYIVPNRGFAENANINDTALASITQPLKTLLDGGSTGGLTRGNLSVRQFQFGELFVSAYSPGNRVAWIVTCAIAAILTHVFPFAFYYYIKKRVIAKKQNEYDNPFAFSGLESTQIPGNDRVTEFERTLRIFASVALYLALLAISFVIIFVLERAKQSNRGKLTISGVDIIDIAVTLTVTVINIVFGAVAGFMTTFEKHLTYSQYRRSHTLKLYSFKIFNVIAMYTAVGAVALSAVCPYFDAGRKFLILIITEMVVQNLLEILLPWFKMRILPLLSTKFAGSGSDESNRPEFDLAQEYLELLYRQFIIYVGFSTFPLLPLFGFLVNLVEYPLDKYRMTKVCQRPKRVDVSLKWLLSLLLMANAILALALPPLGTAWILAGKEPPGSFYNSNEEFCPVFGEPPLKLDGEKAVVQPFYRPICSALKNATECTGERMLEIVRAQTSCSFVATNLYDMSTGQPLLVPEYTPLVFRALQEVLVNESIANCTKMIGDCILKYENLTTPRTFNLENWVQLMTIKSANATTNSTTISTTNSTTISTTTTMMMTTPVENSSTATSPTTTV
jgi:hypothetical protein